MSYNIPVSIIVPVYNASKHIPSLIESVQKQTNTNWELLLVDDGSKDNSLELCKKYQAEDSRIKVLHQENQGPSAARNAGILAATGEWVTFVDADDSLLDCFLSSMVEMLHCKQDIDIVFAGYVVVENSQNSIYTYNTAVYCGFEAIKEVIAKTNILHRCCPWGKMFRRSVILEHNVLFDTQLAHSEDRLFVYDFLLHTNGVATTSAIGYLYDSTQTGTLKNKVLSIDKLKCRQQKLTAAAHKVIDCFKLDGEELFPIAKHLIFLYATAVQGFYYVLGNTKKTREEQLTFYNENFDTSLYDKIKELDEWKRYSRNNEMLSLALKCRFGRINTKLSIIDKKIQVRRFCEKMYKRMSVKQDFSTVVFVLNNLWKSNI